MKLAQGGPSLYYLGVIWFVLNLFSTCYSIYTAPSGPEDNPYIQDLAEVFFISYMTSAQSPQAIMSTRPVSYTALISGTPKAVEKHIAKMKASVTHDILPGN